MKLYLDMCIYNRPFDDQSQPRIMIETQIFIILLEMIFQGHFKLINSFALEYENIKNPDIENMLKISDLLSCSREYIPYDEHITVRAIEFEKFGILGMDAIHIACAEKAKADYFVTCDDNLIRKLAQIDNIGLTCYNLIDFASMEVFET